MKRAGILLGAGLGGFVDGIVFHQILQWHNMLSALKPPNDLVATKVNMVWDGYFHAGVWVLTVLGVVALYRAGTRDPAPGAGARLSGGIVMGWGLFNLIEGTVDHHILQLHHVRESAGADSVYDLAFLGVGALFLVLGMLVARTGKINLDS